MPLTELTLRFLGISASGVRTLFLNAAMFFVDSYRAAQRPYCLLEYTAFSGFLLRFKTTHSFVIRIVL